MTSTPEHIRDIPEEFRAIVNRYIAEMETRVRAEIRAVRFLDEKSIRENERQRIRNEWEDERFGKNPSERWSEIVDCGSTCARGAELESARLVEAATAGLRAVVEKWKHFGEAQVALYGASTAIPVIDEPESRIKAGNLCGNLHHTVEKHQADDGPFKPHTWVVEETESGLLGVNDFWSCSECGASGGPVGEGAPMERRDRPFLAGPALQLSIDCDMAKNQIAELGFAIGARAETPKGEP